MHRRLDRVRHHHWLTDSVVDKIKYTIKQCVFTVKTFLYFTSSVVKLFANIASAFDYRSLLT